MKYPNFIIAGAAKAGTTTLYNILNQHADIFLTDPKEPQYFVSEKFKKSGKSDKPAYYGGQSVFDKDAYKRLYDKVDAELAIGEASTIYLHDPESHRKIFEEIPNVKLIFMLRNPVDRAYSQFLHQVRDGREKYDSFGEALEAEAERKEKNWGPFWYYKSSGEYYRQLKPYFKTFPEENIKVIIFEHFIKNKEKTISEILEFLSIKDNYQFNYSIHKNKTGYPKLKFLNDLLNARLLKIIHRKTKHIMPNYVSNGLKGLKNKNIKKKKMSSEVREMLQNYYKHDLNELSHLLDDDLLIWNINKIRE